MKPQVDRPITSFRFVVATFARTWRKEVHVLTKVATGAFCGVFCLLCLSWNSVSAAEPNSPAKRKLVLLSQGPDGHAATEHEYHAGVRILGKILARIPDLEIEMLRADGVWEEGPEKLRQADGALLFLSQGAKWIHEEPRRLEAFAQLAARGGGLMALHWGMGTKEPQYIDGFVKLFGGCHGGPDRKYKILDTTVTPTDNPHEIFNGIQPFRVHEEFYYKLKFVGPTQTLRPVAAVEIDGTMETVSWAWERADGGRSFGYSGCHYHRNWELADCRRLVSQGIVWAMKLPVPKDGINVDVTADDLKLP